MLSPSSVLRKKDKCLKCAWKYSIQETMIMQTTLESKGIIWTYAEKQ